MIRWVNECINASTEATIIVPGHGEVSNRAGLTDFAVCAFDAKYSDFLISPAFFIELIYMDV